MGLRYLRSKKNSGFLSFITVLSVAGVGIGVTSLIVVLSVMDGFEAEQRSRLLNSDLHILVTPTSRVPGFEQGRVPTQAWAPALATKEKTDPKIASINPVLATEVILKTSRKVTGVQIKGVTQARLDRLKEQVQESADPQFLVNQSEGGRVRLPSIFLGQELAYELSIIPGDQVTLVSPLETEGPIEAVPVLKRFVVEGIYHSGLPEQEGQIAFALDSSVQAFLRKSEVVTHWELTVRDFEDAPNVARRLEKAYPDFRFQDWVQLNAHLFSALKLERSGMFIGLALIIVVASFNIVSTLTLMVLEKRREIAILKTMGAKTHEVGAIFLAEGLWIATVGVLGGGLLGFLICVILKRYEFIQLPDVYQDRTLPVTFSPAFYLWVAVCAYAIVLVACLYPARRASRMVILDGIRAN